MSTDNPLLHTGCKICGEKLPRLGSKEYSSARVKNQGRTRLTPCRLWAAMGIGDLGRDKAGAGVKN